MSRTVSLAARVAILALCGAAASADADETNGSWRCVAANGSYDQIMLPVPDGARSITGQLSFHTPHLGPRWPSAARIGFVDDAPAKDGNCRCHGVAVEAFRDTSRVDLFMLSAGRYELAANAPFDTPITFRITIDDHDMMTTTFGKSNPVSKTTELPHNRRDWILMTCTGSEVSFIDVRTQ